MSDGVWARVSAVGSVATALAVVGATTIAWPSLRPAEWVPITAVDHVCVSWVESQCVLTNTTNVPVKTCFVARIRSGNETADSTRLCTGRLGAHESRTLTPIWTSRPPSCANGCTIEFLRAD